jgi:hypothetical protein
MGGKILAIGLKAKTHVITADKNLLSFYPAKKKKKNLGIFGLL